MRILPIEELADQVQYIQNKKQKELLRQAKLEEANNGMTNDNALSPNGTSNELPTPSSVPAPTDSPSRMMPISMMGDDGDGDDDDEPKAKSEDDLLAEQMQRDAELEVKRLIEEKENVKKAHRELRDDSDAESDDDESSSSSSDTDTLTISSSLASPQSLSTATAARFQSSSSRGDVFTASGAGQYALARKLRGQSLSQSVEETQLANGVKRAAVEEFKRRMVTGVATTDAKQGTSNSSSDPSPSNPLTDSNDILPLDRALAMSSGSRTQCGHLTVKERIDQYGPCVVQLPSGSVVGEVALTTAGQRTRRTATIITMEPTFFIKLHGDVVSRLTFGGRAATNGGVMGQDAIANFLKSLDILKIVKGSATGAGTGSHATFKRLAYHLRDRTLASGVRVIEQGVRSEFVYFLVSGSCLMTRTVLVNGTPRGRHGKRRDRFCTHPQFTNEPFQRIDTSYLPETMTCDLPKHATTSGKQSTQNQNASSVNSSVQSSSSLTDPSSTNPGSSSFNSLSPPHLAPPPSGLQLRIELTTIGSGELIGGYEAFLGSVHNSTFTVTSSECVVLQMKRSHFLNLFPSRALELVKAVGDQRASLYQARVEKFITLRCRGMNDHPHAAGLANMVGSGLKIEKKAAAAAAAAANTHSDTTQINKRDDTLHGEVDEDLPVSSSDHSLPDLAILPPSSPPQLTGSHSMKVLRPVTAAMTPAIRSAVSGSATSSSVVLNNILSSPAMSMTARHSQQRDRETAAAASDVVDDVIALDEHDIIVSSPLSSRVQDAISAVNGISSSFPAGASPSFHSSPVSTDRRKPHHVLAPPVNKQPKLQSSTLMQALKLKPVDVTPPLTPVQKALGYTEEPTPATRSWAEQESLKEERTIESETSIIRPLTALQAESSKEPIDQLHSLQTSASEIILRTHLNKSTDGGSLSSSFSSHSLASELSASSQLERAAHEADIQARRRSMRRGSIKIQNGMTGLGGVEYTTMPQAIVPTASQLSSLTNKLSHSARGIIGVDDLTDTLRDRLEDEATIANLASSTGDQIQARRLSFTNSSNSINNNSTPIRPSALHGTNQPDVNSPPLISPPITSTSRSSSDDRPSSLVGTARHSLSSSSPSIAQLDVESRALVLMRAEKAQMLWEASEVNRRGHRLMEKVRPTSYNMGEEEKQAMLSRSLAWDTVQITDPSSQSNAFIHSASPPLAVMHNANLIASTTNFVELKPSSCPVVVGDPSLADTVRPILGRSSTPVRTFTANRAARNPSDLHASPSPIIRSLLMPLVDPNFTSMYEIGMNSDVNGGMTIGSLGIGGAVDSTTPLLLSTSSTSRSSFQTPDRKRSVQGARATHPSQRPSTANDRITRSQQQSTLVSASRSNASTPARPMTSSASVNSLHHSQHLPISFGIGGSAPSLSGVSLSGTNLSTQNVRMLTPHRVSSAGMSRSSSVNSLSTPTSATRKKVSQQINHAQLSNGRLSNESGAYFQSSTQCTIDDSISAWNESDHQSPDTNTIASSNVENNGGSMNRNANSNDLSAFQSNATASPLVSSSHHSSAVNSNLASPVSATIADPSVSSSPLYSRSPIRHTRTNSLGGFMRLQAAGVDRQPTHLSINSPKAGSGSGSGSGSHSPWTNPNGTQASENTSHPPTSSVLYDGSVSSPVTSPKNIDPFYHTRTLQPTSSSFSPIHYHAASISAFTKQSFIDDRTSASIHGARVVQDSHQSIYSRSRSHTPLPGTKANPPTGDEALTKEEFESLRRKKLYHIAVPKVVPDQPSIFSKVLSLSDALPGKLLTSKTGHSHKKARLDEIAVQRAARDGLASKIIQHFKEATERTM